LIDDFSEEPCPPLVQEFLELHAVRYIRHEQNRGLASARNTAIKHANGEYFSFCDDDDQWSADLAKNLLQTAEMNLEVGGICIALNPITRGDYLRKKNLIRLQDLMLRGVTPPVGSQLYSTTLLRNIEGYNENVKSGVDHDLWVRLSSINPLVSIFWGQGAIVDSDPSADRLTTKQEIRVKNIKESLKIWKSTLEKVFGSSFYIYFYKEYLEVLEYDFFRQSIYKKDLFGALKKTYRLNIIKRCVAAILRKTLFIKSINKFKRYNKK
jgi:glycosyltransferase involved in cell wall biosynthesis